MWVCVCVCVDTLETCWGGEFRAMFFFPIKLSHRSFDCENLVCSSSTIGGWKKRPCSLVLLTVFTRWIVMTWNLCNFYLTYFSLGKTLIQNYLNAPKGKILKKKYIFKWKFNLKKRKSKNNPKAQMSKMSSTPPRWTVPRKSWNGNECIFLNGRVCSLFSSPAPRTTGQVGWFSKITNSVGKEMGGKLRW